MGSMNSNQFHLLIFSLFNWIYSQKKTIPLQTIYKFLKEIALGMYYLHSRTPQIIHRDLKSLNILV